MSEQDIFWNNWAFFIFEEVTVALSKGLKARNKKLTADTYIRSSARILAVLEVVYGFTEEQEGTWERDVGERVWHLLFPRIQLNPLRHLNRTYQQGVISGHLCGFMHWIADSSSSKTVQREVGKRLSTHLAAVAPQIKFDKPADWEVFKAWHRGFADGVNVEPVVGAGKLSREKGHRLDVYLKLWEKRTVVNDAVQRREKREWLYGELFPNSAISWHSFEKACEDIGLLRRE